MALDLNSPLIKKKKSVIRYNKSPDENFDAFDSPEEARKKIENKQQARNKTLNKKVKSLEKIERKTNELIKKSKKKAIAKPSAKSSKAIAKPSANHSEKLSTASYIEFLCKIGLKKKVLENIKKNAFHDGGNWKSFIDTEEIKLASSKSSNLIRDAIYRMKDENWFTVIHSSLSGRRIVEIKPEIYGIK